MVNYAAFMTEFKFIGNHTKLNAPMIQDAKDLTLLSEQ